MAVPIGISVGDFIASIKLLKDVADALKDQHGAASHFQATVQKLEQIQAVLTRLEAHTSASANTTLVQAIRGQSQLVNQGIKEFLDDTQKYQDKLGASSRPGVWHSPIAKVKWSQLVVKRVQSLDHTVATQLRTIHLLLSIDAAETAQQLSSQQTTLTQSLSGLRGDFRHQCTSSNIALSSLRNDIDSVGSSVNTRLSTAEDEISKRLDDMHAQISQQLSTLVSSQQTIRQCGTSPTPSDTNMAHGSHNCEMAVTTKLSRLVLAWTIPQLKMPRKHMLELLRHLSAEIEVWLRYCIANWLLLLKSFLMDLPQVLLLLRLLHRLPQAVSLVLHDNMSFEDALGRVHSLQYQQFKHWRMFEEIVRCSFVDLPGWKEVQYSQFILTLACNPQVRLSAANYTQLVQPGISIKMWITLSSLTGYGGKCPRGCGGDIGGFFSRTKKCCCCGFEYMRESKVLLPPVVIHNPSHAIRLLSAGSSSGYTLQRPQNQSTTAQSLERNDTKPKRPAKVRQSSGVITIVNRNSRREHFRRLREIAQFKYIHLLSYEYRRMKTK